MIRFEIAVHGNQSVSVGALSGCPGGIELETYLVEVKSVEEFI
jgi:hypothetical protein